MVTSRAMHEGLTRYAESLPEEERDLLLSSVPFLISLCVGADRQFDQLEVEAAVDSLLEATKVLGDAFRYSPAAERAFDVISARADEGWSVEAGKRLTALGAVVRAMPPDVQQPYHEFVTKMCLHLVESSGTLLWFGKRISEEEKGALFTIAQELGVPLRGKLAEAAGADPAR